MPKYGVFHSLGDFVTRLVPKKGSTTASFAAVHAVMTGLKRLDAVQARNPDVTFTVSTGDGIWVRYQGLRTFLIIPGQRSLRIVGGSPGGDEAAAFDTAASAGTISDTTGTNDYRQWNVPLDETEVIWSFVEAYPIPSSARRAGPRTAHPRYFSGAVRQAALEDFEREGRRCPGVAGRSDAHKLKGEDRIEFDHVLPYAKNGTSTLGNIQVLCFACNRMKGPTAR